MPSASPCWRVLTHALGDVTFVRFTGDKVKLNEEISPWLLEQLSRLVEGGRDKLAVDLGNVEYLTSAAVEVFLAVRRKLRPRGGRLSLCNPRPVVAEVFAALKLGTVFDVYATTRDMITPSAN
jgi:anti-sigma B factor antagonist